MSTTQPKSDNNPWQTTAVLATTAFAIACGAAYMISASAEKEQERNQKAIAEAQQRTFHADRCTGIPMTNAHLSVCVTSDRSANPLLNVDRVGYGFTGKSVEGTPVEFIVKFEVDPRNRLDAESYERLLVQDLAAKTAKGMSVCDLERQGDNYMPSFTSSLKTAFLGAADKYTEQVDAKVNSAIGAMKKQKNCL